MIEQIAIVTATSKKNILVTQKTSKYVIDFDVKILNSSSFDIEILFSEKIISFRNHDYTWKLVDDFCLADELAPKAIQLHNGYFVQPNLSIGYWVLDKNTPNKLLWRLNPKDSKPLTVYSGNKNQKKINQANTILNFIEQPALLFSKKGIIEFSRSKKPFSAVACFTDHCDFDTLDNLKMQRAFFKDKGITVTKGFFLNHFSKREDNASFENDSSELDLWNEDGHELCFHSLSQSLKDTEDSFIDFEQFDNPYQSTTWIDHGYQPYNFSLYQNFNRSNEYFETILNKKKVTTLWNYIDSGTATTGVINQCNAKHFSMNAFLYGNRKLGFVKKMQLIIKNIIFHYYAEESVILKYKSTAAHFKNLVYKKQLKAFLALVKAIIAIAIPLIKVIAFWGKHKNKPYKLARYTPILFKHKIENTDFFVFQTIEMIDFKQSLSPKNIDSLIDEKGLFIAHTYFSVPMAYHQGKMFDTLTTINDEVAKNFEYLGLQIKNNKIWNPTLKELKEYLINFEKIVLDCDDFGNIIVKNNPNLIYRTII